MRSSRKHLVVADDIHKDIRVVAAVSGVTVLELTDRLLREAIAKAKKQLTAV